VSRLIAAFAMAAAMLLAACGSDGTRKADVGPRIGVIHLST
jgi:hypothetical protein